MTFMTRYALVLAGLSLAAPAVARAEHRLDNAALLPAAENLHRSIVAFERIAAVRPFPRHEKDYIHHMTQRACRLVDGLKCNSHWGRVKGDHVVLHDFVREVDRRLQRSCQLRYDPVLSRRWQCVLDEFDAITCVINPRLRQLPHYVLHDRHLAPAIPPAGPAHRPGQRRFEQPRVPADVAPRFGQHVPAYGQPRYQDQLRYRPPATAIEPTPPRQYHDAFRGSRRPHAAPPAPAVDERDVLRMLLAILSR